MVPFKLTAESGLYDPLFQFRWIININVPECRRFLGQRPKYAFKVSFIGAAPDCPRGCFDRVVRRQIVVRAQLLDLCKQRRALYKRGRSFRNIPMMNENSAKYAWQSICEFQTLLSGQATPKHLKYRIHGGISHVV